MKRFIAEFTCIYRLEARTLTDFKAKRKDLERGMQSICSVTVRVWKMAWSEDTSELGREREGRSAMIDRICSSSWI